jgi:hypothetical protein
MVEIAGLGLIVKVWLTVETLAFVPLPFVTPICTLPCVVSRDARTTADNWVELT